MKADPQATERVLAFLEKAGGTVTEGDVAAGAGLDVANAKASLYDLMLRYECHLEVHEDGTLAYDFGRKLVSLTKRTWRDIVKSIGKWSWKIFSWVYKASLAVVLVAYTITFVVLILAAALAASAASEDEGPAEGAFRLVGHVFIAIFDFHTAQAITYVAEDRHGYKHRHYEPKKPVMRLRKGKPAPKSRSKKHQELEEHPKGFVASVYDFVLGPERVRPDDRAQTRELASFVRERGGALSIADVQALSGLTRDESETLFARFVAEFEGETDITDDGALIARFPELQRSTSTEHDEPIIWYWDEYEAPYEVTGNTVGKNILIAALAGFNLVCSLFMTVEFGVAGGLLGLLGVVPSVIFGLFFAIPAVRSLWVSRKNSEQHEHNIRKRLFRAIFKRSILDDDTSTLPIRRLAALANAAEDAEEMLDADKIRPLFEATMRDIGGDVDLHEEHDLVVNLDQLRAEIDGRRAQAAFVVGADEQSKHLAFSTERDHVSLTEYADVEKRIVGS